MRQFIQIATTILALAVISLGCSKGGSVDTAPLEKQFASAEAALKTAADSAVTKIKNADYKGALEELQKLASNVKLTDEQKKALSDVVAQVQKAITEMAGKAAGEADKALNDAQKALGK